MQEVFNFVCRSVCYLLLLLYKIYSYKNCSRVLLVFFYFSCPFSSLKEEIRNLPTHHTYLISCRVPPIGNPTTHIRNTRHHHLLCHHFLNAVWWVVGGYERFYTWYSSYSTYHNHRSNFFKPIFRH